jgi:peptidoglycan/LPS O-acetylase OafA/YrhL
MDHDAPIRSDSIAPMTRGYRPALDGVRALAVLAVISYHLGLPVSGGFLGVDVFFVLSGYLITDLLLAEHDESGRVRLGRFWARRARRLLPALLVVVAACAVEISRNEPLLGLGPRRADMLATLAYYANWHFIATDQSYFATYTGASPLRHMWSLAIEEQFYLVWPLLLVGLLRLTRQAIWLRVLAVGVAAGASALALAMEYNVANPSRAYLGTDGRAHELLIGAVLAFAVQSGCLSRLRRLNRVVPMSSLILFAAALGAIAVVPDTTPAYYRGGSVAFCLVIALLLLTIETDPSGEVARLLSRRPLVLVGRISYGLYLWHWPVILWLHAPDGSWLRRLASIALIFGAATLSYVVVEAPARRGRMPWVRGSTRRLAIAVPLALAAVAGLAVAATASSDVKIVKQLADQSVRACPPGGPGWCVRAPRPHPGAVLIAVIGDSTSLALDPGMRAEAARRGFGYVQAGRNGCTFLPLAMQADDPAMTGTAKACAAGAMPLLNHLSSQMHPDVWLVSDRLLRFWLHEGGRRYPIGSPQHDVAVARALRRTLVALTASGGKVALLETLPDGQEVDCGLQSRRRTCGAGSTSLADQNTEQVNVLLRAVAAELPKRVSFVPTGDLVCAGPDGQCVPLQNGVVIRYDGVHYTGRFSRQVVPLILNRLSAAGIALPGSAGVG